MSKTVDEIVEFIKREAHVSNGGVVIGMSGGVDSAVVAALARRALEPHRIQLVMMPCNDLVDMYAMAYAEELEMGSMTISIGGTFNKMMDSGVFELLASCSNLKARLRMCVLYGIANTREALVVGTTNKSEWEVGYFTKYGDGGCDIEPIIHLYKTQVYEIAEELGVPDEIIKRAPSADLYPGQTDEGEMGVSYAVLDEVLQGRKDKATATQLASINTRRMLTEHKRHLPRGVRG